MLVRALQKYAQDTLYKAGFQLSHAVEVPARSRQLLLAHAHVMDLLDIGANTGQWATDVRRFGYRGRLWSFEPLSREYAACAANARRDAGWHVERCAVGDKPGTLPLRVAENPVFSSFLPVLARGVQADPAAGGSATEDVPVRTLDDIASGLAGPLGVKMDVQGYESRVLDGGAEALKAAAYLEMELSLVPLYEGEPLYQEMLDRISGLGFRLVMVEPVWPDRRTGEALQFNGIFLPQ